MAENLRFPAKLLQDVGLTQMAPDEVVAKGTDLRFTEEPKE